MSKLSRRNFLFCLSSATVASFIIEKAEAQVKGVEFISPDAGVVYTVPGGITCSAVQFPRKQLFPKIARVDYKADGVFIGSGTKERQYTFTYSPPIPSSTSIQKKMITAEVIQSGTENITATASVELSYRRILG